MILFAAASPYSAATIILILGGFLALLIYLLVFDAKRNRKRQHRAQAILDRVEHDTSDQGLTRAEALLDRAENLHTGSSDDTSEQRLTRVEENLDQSKKYMERGEVHMDRVEKLLQEISDKLDRNH